MTSNQTASSTDRLTTHTQSRVMLLDLITNHCGEDLSSWLVDRAQHLSSGFRETRSISDLVSKLGAQRLDVRRRSSKRYLVTAFAEREHATLLTPLGLISVGKWRRDEAATVWLTAQTLATCLTPAEVYQVLYDVYDAADTEGRVDCLRALNLLEGSVEDGLKIIHDAGRTYLNDLMEAGWCNNPFASTHLSDEEYRKALLKSLFCDVPVQGFLELERRADAELSRSLYEFANEREAAGRVVPSAVLRVAAYYPQPGLIARLIGRLEHPSIEERLTAAIGLERARDERALSFVRERLSVEDDPEVHAALTQTESALTLMTSAEERSS